MAIQQVDLVGDSRPVVTPQATATMAQAVRDGTISILDIMDRVDHRTRAKQELELITAEQGIAEATDPQLIEAKRNVQLAEGATAAGTVANAPLAQQAKTAELKAAIFDAQSKPGGYDLMQTALSKGGFPVAVDPNAGLTEANKAEILKRFTALAEYTQKKTEAADRVKNIESKFFPTEQTTAAGTTKGQLQKLFHNGQEISSDQLKTWAQEAATLERTPFSSYYLLKPGQASAAQAPTAPAPLIQPAITPAQANAQRAQLFNAGVPNAAAMTNAQIQAQSIIQPSVTAPAPVIVPSTPQIGQTTPGLGIVTSVEAAGPPKPPTEPAGRAGSFAGRMYAAENQLNAVVSSGFDPTKASVAFQQSGVVPEGLKLDDVKRFENAKLQWVTALLRRESGAAVPKWELTIYDKAFFPQWGDPPDVIAQKAAIRQQSAQSLLQESEGQRTFVPPITPTPAAPVGGAPAGMPAEQTLVIGGKTYIVRTDSTGAKRYFVR